MKRLYFIFFLFINYASSFGQWNKLPTQYINNYWSTAPPGGSIIFPYSLFPVGNGHILISSYYDNGSVSAFAYSINLYETYDDFSTHRLVPNMGYPYCLYAKNDSNYIWYENNNPVDQSNIFNRRLMHTSSDFLQVDTINYCPPNSPPYNSPTSCITTSFLYSLFQGVSPYDDTLMVEKYSLANASLSCKKIYAYNSGSLKFINDSIGFISSSYKTNSSKKVLLKTVDYGQSWNEIYIDSVNSISDFSFFSADTGCLLVSNGSLLKTTNSGSTWLALPAISTIESFSFYDANTGYIGGSNGFLNKTIDGGQTWTNEISGTNNAIISIYTFSNNVTYFKDSLSDLYKNIALVGIKQVKNNEQILIYPNPSNDNLIIEINNTTQQNVQLFDVTGKLVLTQTINEKGNIDASLLREGVYTLSITNNQGKINKKVVIIR